MNEIDLLLERIDKLNTKIKTAERQYDKIQYAYEISRVVKAIEQITMIE